MGLFDGRSSSPTYYEVRHRSHSHSGSGHQHNSNKESSRGYFVRPAASSRSSSSFFSSSRGIFGGGGGSSSYRRSPRAGYIQYLWNRLQRMLRELWAYARRHPMKAFFAVVVPLVSAGGAIHGIMRQFGVRVPDIPGLEGLAGGRGRSTVGGGYYGSSGYGGLGGGGGAGGLMSSAGSLMQIAKAFV